MNILYRILFAFYICCLCFRWGFVFIVWYSVFPFVLCCEISSEGCGKQLAECFPGKTVRERLAVERQFYHFFCDYVMEVIKMFSISREEMKRRMEFTNLDEVRADLEREDKSSVFFIWDITVIGNI